MAKYEEKSREVLQLISEGYTNKAAIEKANITEQTFYQWIKTKAEFSELVQRARKEGEQKAVRDVEAALLDLAKGMDYEDVRTEYESKLNPTTGQYEPVIKKQVRVKKHIPANTEAIKFFLTNKAPDEWKNRIEQNNTGNLATDLRIKMVSEQPDDEQFPNSENEVDTTRGDGNNRQG